MRRLTAEEECDPAKAAGELKRIFREHDAGRLSEARYNEQAHALEALVSGAFSSRRISAAAFHRFCDLYERQMHEVNDI